MDIVRYSIKVKGIVQGVGFRPFVYGLAKRLDLAGWVYNCASGVFIEIEGDQSSCAAFLDKLRSDAPSLARIDSMEANPVKPLRETDFFIKESIAGEKETLISPDMGICEHCLQDMNDIHNRRYRYAFTNCTNCGPRFTIIKDLPYDRPYTTMSSFRLCAECQKEYTDPSDRRFHAQPNACPICGPSLYFTNSRGEIIPGDPIEKAKSYLTDGKILAVKSIGGYHLVCDAANNEAVISLRQRKLRWDKPFAVMVKDISKVKKYCECSEAEAELLKSQRRPIVLLKKHAGVEKLGEQIAPNNPRLGIMLPYTPLHYLLIEGFDALVMTSANISDEPIAYRDDDAYERLSDIADGFLTHNRDIFRRCDDSVLIFADNEPVFFRRARGYAPEPISISAHDTCILALGPQQKNTFCLTRGDKAFISQHIGDLDDEKTFTQYTKELADFSRMFNCKPQIVVTDKHPQYRTSVYAKQELDNLPQLAVQHHYAHFASVLAEHSINSKAIGLIFDGTGYGDDGNMWGGEILVGDMYGYIRSGHLRYIPMPGGEQAIREPWRMALGMMLDTFTFNDIAKYAPEGLLPRGWKILAKAAISGINTPLTSGMGRLFDGIAALAGIRRVVNYEGQAAIELEQAIDMNEKSSYHIIVYNDTKSIELDWRPLLRSVLSDLRAGIKTVHISTKFHRAVINMTAEICGIIRARDGLNNVVLSGGCWQNMYLLLRCRKELEDKGFKVYTNRQVPVNDGGIAYGQAAIAAARLNRREINVFGDTR